MQTTSFWILFPNIWDLDSRLEGYGHVSSMAYFSKIFERQKKRRFKTNLTLSLILRLNLRLESYSIWIAIFIAPHIKVDLKTTHCMSTLQPRGSQGSTQRITSRWSFRRN
jgi:hypothetical protein